MRSSADKADAVAEALATLEEVEYSVVTTGSYPVLIWVAAESVEELGNLLRTRIGGIDGVRKTQAFLNLSIKKRGFGRVQ